MEKITSGDFMEKEKTGPKPVQINFEVLDAMLQFKVTKKYCAEYLRVSEDTIERRIKERTGQTFTEYAENVRQGLSVKLQTTAIEMALFDKHPTMMIFALKNLCGWSDKIENTVVELPEIKLAYKEKGE